MQRSRTSADGNAAITFLVSKIDRPVQNGTLDVVSVNDQWPACSLS
jgi:hypothetical protein